MAWFVLFLLTIGLPSLNANAVDQLLQLNQKGCLFDGTSSPTRTDTPQSSSGSVSISYKANYSTENGINYYTFYLSDGTSVIGTIDGKTISLKPGAPRGRWLQGDAENNNRTERQTDDRIVGGRMATAGQFPFIGIQFAGEYLCGGTLISPSFFVSAAHCDDPEKVVLGALKLWPPRSSNAKEIRVKNFTRHPDWVHPNKPTDLQYNDIMLVELSESVEYSKWIRPACLTQKADLTAGTDTTVAGWGDTSSGGSVSQVLLEADVPIVGQDECKSFFANYRDNFPDGVIHAKHVFCAGGGEKDTCQGDSGGPLIQYNQNYQTGQPKEFLIGVTSNGAGCAKGPGVYTLVQSFLPWIADEMQKAGAFTQTAG